ncbi:ABC transporter ATP-binding protein [Pseudooceanicola batsensis HTCC2597]|uniref:ABC transporter ATP-binding protein n=1 Tax=Pseudooceanicola batsensis (strain ATCC BAA-863 / DSM 15984 / KCTC 12145 / HTCC2597) TaxID=252305 RepID=A3U1H6_PSEBH|nr:ABC transporter ATP-binding protein [Pseudooceanicola batsensis]EAQ02159.1 ABC transporter ATP-binding protein [Pseudooceanicola batsensis HTCC2597]
MTQEPVLEIRDVVKQYGDVRALGPVGISVREGEFLTLLGPSGCGKTTTLHIIAGLTNPTEGSVSMKGRDITALEPPQRDMGLVFQNYALFPHKTVFDNVAFGLRMRRVPKPEIKERVERVLEVVGLPGIGSRYPSELSGGQRQRVAVARAVVIEPSILLLDEPLSNLDAVLRKRMRLDLRNIQQRLGITTIFVTHDQDEAFEMSDRVILMNKGGIEQSGPPEEMYDRPESRFAAEFIGEANLVAGEVVEVGQGELKVKVAEAIFTAPAGKMTVAQGDRVTVMVRPERVEVSKTPISGGNTLQGKVSSRVFSGDQVSLTMRVTEDLELLCSKPSTALYRGFDIGDPVWISADDCWVLPRVDTRKGGAA